MTILLSGGGTGGHITPILAVASELKRRDPGIKTVYVAERAGAFGDMAKQHPAIDEIHTIRAGKFRRYHGESWLRRLLDVKTIFLNARDALYVCVGTLQALRLLGKVKPQAVFLKGGFVGVPVGIAARLRGIPFITHDSDAVPGLANRLVGRWAAVHATALPPEAYPQYPAASTEQVGVIVQDEYQLVTEERKRQYRRQLQLPEEGRVLLITGGSSGAERINQAVVKIIQGLLTADEALYVVHQTGKGKSGVYGDYRHERLRVVEFMSPMHAYTGAADLVVSRASANTLAELGVQAKPVIVVASRFLADGHQLRNAERLSRNGAAVALDETEIEKDPQVLQQAVRELLSDDSRRAELAARLHELTVPDAARSLSDMLIKCAGG